MEIKSIFVPLRTRKFWKELVIMTVGMAIAAAAVYYFLLPSKLVVGSTSGLAIVVSELLAKAGFPVKVSAIITVFNIVLLVLAYLLIGKEFGLKTCYTAIILGPMMDLWEKICPFERLIEPGATSVMGDLWFDMMCFILILSASQAIMFSINASTGGLDIPAKIVNKYLHFDIGTSVTVSGLVISCSGFFINPFRLVIVGLIGTWLNGLIVDYFTVSLNRRKRVCIISDEHEKVRGFIVNNIQRGCSLYEVRGGYSLEKSVEIQCLLTKDEFSDLMAFIREQGIKAFITAGNVSEVYGLWSKHKKLRK